MNNLDKIFDLTIVKGQFEFGVSFSPNGIELLIVTQFCDITSILYTKVTRFGCTRLKRAFLLNGNILITETGNEVLSVKLPKTIKEIEKIMTEKNRLTFK